MNANITNNHFTNDGIFLLEDMFFPKCNSHSITTDNTVNGKPLYYHKDRDGIIIDGIPVGQLILAACKNVIVKNLEITDTDVGIELVSSTNITLRNNNISSNNQCGIFVSSGSSKNKIKENNISFNGINGIQLNFDVFGYSGKNDITKNIILLNHQNGIYVSSSHNNITNNNISENINYGILISGFTPPKYNNVAFNNIFANGWSGVHLSSHHIVTLHIIIYMATRIMVFPQAAFHLYNIIPLQKTTYLKIIGMAFKFRPHATATLQTTSYIIMKETAFHLTAGYHLPNIIIF